MFVGVRSSRFCSRLPSASVLRQPFYPQVATTIPPVPPGQGRIYFYRNYEPYESRSRPYLYLNRQVAGVSIPGGVFYRDESNSPAVTAALPH
jgi:hypothetical protein